MIDEKILLKVKEALDNHGVIAFPTETVMGLAVYFDDFKAYNKLNQVKRRPENKPYSMMVKNSQEIEKYAVVDDRIRKIINAFMPGPITLLLKTKEVLPEWVTHNSGIIGIRIPSHEVSLDILNAIEKPILVPSANKSGNPPALTAKQVEEIFQNELDFIVPGEANLEKASTIVDLTKEEIVVVRPGPITLEMIKEAIKY